MIIDTRKIISITEANQNFSKAVRIADEHGDTMGSISGVAPRADAISAIKIYPMISRTAPQAMTKYISREKISFAFLFLPCPRVMDTRALPPVPIIKPMDERIIRTGMMRLTAANAVAPT